MLRRFHWLPIALVLVGVFASIVTLLVRHTAESRSRTVALVLDYTQVRSLSSATGVPVARALKRFKEAGATGVAITEDTLGALRADGVITVDMKQTESGREY